MCCKANRSVTDSNKGHQKPPKKIIDIQFSLIRLHLLYWQNFGIKCLLIILKGFWESHYPAIFYKLHILITTKLIIFFYYLSKFSFGYQVSFPFVFMLITFCQFCSSCCFFLQDQVDQLVLSLILFCSFNQPPDLIKSQAHPKWTMKVT